MPSLSSLTPLSVSLVVHTLDDAVLAKTLRSLQRAINHAHHQDVLGAVQVYLIDNSERSCYREALQKHSKVLRDHSKVTVVSGHGNIGFGRAHNLALAALACQPDEQALHLVLNPDVFLQRDTLVEGIGWMQNHVGTAACAPAISDGNGQRASACKRYPSVFNFLLRGFAPSFVKTYFRRRLARYEMADMPENQPSQDVPVISGCFMLFRRSVLQSLGGFDARYFLYFEDFDLSMRAHKLGSLTYLPQMRIVHLGGNSAGKGLRHIGLFGRSAIRFFNRHGWRWL